MNERTLLTLNNLTVVTEQDDEEKTIVDQVSLTILPKKIVSIVGGSGSGKTTTGLSILRLLDPALQIKSGEIIFMGYDLLKYSAEKMRQVRGKEISMVFQEPLDAFNPVISIGYQIQEVLKTHTKLSRKERREKVFELLELVGLPEPKRVAKQFPHQLSGGMRQRAMIAQAIAAEPKLIIADEPTSNLDVTLQARIIDLFKKLAGKLNLSILLITHDLGMVRYVADEVAVMTHGKIVEAGKTQDVLNHPQHEYTSHLMRALQV